VPEPDGGTLSVPAAVRFPEVGVGLPAISRTVLVSNRSRVSSLAVYIGRLTAPFTVSGAGQYSIPPGASVPLTIGVSPDVVGTATQSLQIISGDPKHPLVSVRISATIQPGRLSVRRRIGLRTKPGSTATKTVILRNIGRGMLSGSVEAMYPGSALTLVGGPVSFTLAPRQTQSITLQFAPSSAGTTSANLAIDTTPPPGTTMISVTGSAR